MRDTMFFFIIFVVVITIILVALAGAKPQSRPNQQTTYHSNRQAPSPIVENTHQWHEPKGQYGSNHKDMVDNHVVNHEQPELGYVILNGIKRKLKDCKDL